MITAGTGLDSFTDPADITTLYPFAGAEVPLVIIGVLAWIGWHVGQIRRENRDYGEALRLYERVGMDRAMKFSSSAQPGTDEDIRAARAELGEGRAARATKVERTRST